MTDAQNTGTVDLEKRLEALLAECECCTVEATIQAALTQLREYRTALEARPLTTAGAAIEAEAERLVKETYKPKGGDYLWTDVVGCVATAIAEERERWIAALKPAKARLSDDIDSSVGTYASAILRMLPTDPPITVPPTTGDVREAAPESHAESYAYAVRLLEAICTRLGASGVIPLPDLFGVLTQIDNATTGLRDPSPPSAHDMREAALEVDRWLNSPLGEYDDPPVDAIWLLSDAALAVKAAVEAEREAFTDDDIIDLINIVTDLDEANALELAYPEVHKRLEAIVARARAGGAK